METGAFEQKARSWRKKALEVSLHNGAGKDEAEDIAQDVMLRLWQMHDELERYRSVEAIVTLMAKHLLRNHQRRKPSETLDEAIIITLDTSPHDELETKENDEWLSAKLQQLPTTQRTLLYMRQVERRSHEEIATLLGIEITSVSTLLARARRTLLEEIKRRNQI
ncbi:MAG: sigma-70 family RNA polymerase sigma factor [Prevotella sp.]|uniref:RNA polymerase sigma factor n=1 Tax=Prevotella sp. khp7 TaxID=1761885 RepID=UPI0008CCF78C|nr:sigma-70 family RNA polymerase sigma factor [Prevotella sp. khp7]MCR5470001.1 sigma-70 family RNA polymerase sigma factor [Prevotella sp.]SEW26849.1 RNA polymerase sigma-70 factor, ECF subfamily [Prevotella sp. khp7]